MTTQNTGPVGCDKNGRPVYRGEWIIDTTSRFLMRAVRCGQGRFWSASGRNVISTRDSLVLTDSEAAQVQGKVAMCDKEAYLALRKKLLEEAAPEIVECVRPGTLIRGVAGYEWVALSLARDEPDELWNWDDDSGNGDEPVVGPFQEGETIIGHIADRIAAAMTAASTLAPSATRTLYAVICRGDRTDAGIPGEYELATRRIFATERDAEGYTASLSTSRDPIIVAGQWAAIKADPSSSRVSIRVVRPPTPSMCVPCVPGFGIVVGSPPFGSHVAITVNDYSVLRLPPGHPHEHGKPAQHIPAGPSALDTIDEWL